MMKKIIVGLSVLIIVCLSIFFYLRILENRGYKNKGALLIERIEKYKIEHGKLPDSIDDLQIVSEMGEGPYYNKVDSLKYIVYFNIGFDNTLSYSSDTKNWKETPSILWTI